MKKGLLSLLAVALTVVSCQNYDDQFQSLTDQITTLSTTVAGLTALTDQVTALQQTVNGLATTGALAALAGQVTDNAATAATNTAAAVTAADAATAAADAAAAAAAQAGTDAASATTAAAAAAAATAAANATTAAQATSNVAQQVASAQASIAQILLDLENVATDADLAAISSTLAQVQLDVKEILNKAETVNQLVRVINEGTLQIAESLIATGTDKPNVLLSLGLTFDTTGFSTSQQARANEIAKKIQTVIGAVSITSTSPLAFDYLSFADDNFTVSGGGADFSALRTVSGDFQSTEIGAVDYTWLGTIDGDITIIAGDGAATNVNSITSIDFSGLTPSGISVGATKIVGLIDAPSATSIKTGNTSVATITANAATDIDFDYTGAIANSLTITGSGTIDILATGASSGITINGVATSIVYANSLIGTPTLTMPTKVAQFHANSIVSASGAINATVVDLSALDHNGGATLSISATDVDLTGFSTPGAGVVTFSGTGAITLTDMDTAKVAAAAVTTLNILSNTGTITFPGTYAELTTLNITTAAVPAINPSVQENITVVSALASLTNLTVAGAHQMVSSVGNANLTSLTTSGNIVHLVVTGATALATANIGHTYILNHNIPVAINIQGTSLSSLDLSTVEKLQSLTVTGNTALTALTAPGTTTLAEAAAVINATIGVNSITSFWTPYQAAKAATLVSPAVAAVPAKLANNSLLSVRNWIDAHMNTQTASPTFTIDSFIASGTSNYANFAALVAADAYLTTAVGGTGSGTIDMVVEKAYIVSE